MPLTAAQRVLYGKIGAHIARSRHDPRELTSEARKSFLARFEAEVRAEYPDLPEPEVQRRAGELRRAHMLALAAKSSIARSKKRTPAPAKASAQEVRALQPRHHRPEQRSTSVGTPTMHHLMIEAEAHARQAGRLCELIHDEEWQRTARLLFRAASRIRTDRLERAA